VLAEHPHLTLTGLYNVLEKLRAGTAPDALDAADRRIFDDGLVLILKEYHDELDTAVAAASGWPADLSDNDILARLVALNQERVKEEAAGQVRWLRPDYQIPRFGGAKDKLALTGGAMNQIAAAEPTGPKPSFPTKELEQTAAVLSMLASAGEPLGATALAVRFKQGRRVLPQIEAVLTALVRRPQFPAAPSGISLKSHLWPWKKPVLRHSGLSVPVWPFGCRAGGKAGTFNAEQDEGHKGPRRKIGSSVGLGSVEKQTNRLAEATCLSSSWWASAHRR
jgi:hypothetical protein